MIRFKHSRALWLAVLPLAIVLTGCPGGDKPKAKTDSKPAKTDEGTKPAKTDTGTAAKDTQPAAPEGWGTVKGRIVYDGEPPAPTVLVKQGDASVKNAERCAAQDVLSEELVVSKENNGIKWALVYIGGRPAVKPEAVKAEGEVVLDQIFCAFTPHVLAYRQGQKLKVTASDPIGHNTKIDPKRSQPFNEMLTFTGEGAKPEKFPQPFRAEPVPFPISCNVHSWMRAWMFVADHPYFAVTGDNGTFELTDVPAGKLKLVIWQEKLSPDGKSGTRDIEVKVGETLDLGEIKLK